LTSDDIEELVRDRWEPLIVRTVEEYIGYELESYRQQIVDEIEEAVRADFQGIIEREIQEREEQEEEREEEEEE
jgi:hypothetical protein